MVLGGLLVAAASLTATDEGAAAGKAWASKDTDWAQFRHDAAKTGKTPATATMRLAYYKWSARTQSSVYASPAAAPVRATGNITDVIVGSFDGRIYCIAGPSGNIRWRYQAGAGIFSSPAIGDLNNDGIAEVLFGSYDDRIYCLNAQDGTLLWRYTTRNIIISSPAIADFNGDGKPEVVIGGSDGNVYALTGAGAKLWIAATPLGGPLQDQGIQASPSVGDVNADGKAEVIMPAGDGKVYALAGADGHQVWNFSTGTSGVLASTAVIADLDGDKATEVFIAGGVNSRAYAITGKDGSEKWNITLGSSITSSPTVGDGDGDGDNEIYFGTDSNQILALDGVNGRLEWSRQFASPIFSSPALADIDGDGRLELVIGGMDRVMRALNAEDGTPAWAYPVPSGIYSSPAVVDLDNDGKAEVVFGCGDGRVYAIDYNF
jgi:outer membrane protein assembly factor BamB